MDSHKTVVANFVRQVSPGQGSPETPTNLRPALGASRTNLMPVLIASPFRGANQSDTHLSSHWELRSDRVPPEMLIETYTAGDHPEVLMLTEPLPDFTIVHWRVRYQDNHGSWSEWSQETSFTTCAVPEQPSNVSPEDGAVLSSRQQTLNSRPFSDADGEDMHTASHWQLAVTNDFSAPLLDTGPSPTALTELELSSETLGYGQTYYWRVRHRDEQGNWSPFSTETSFTIQVPDPPQAGFSSVVAEGTAPLHVHFLDGSSGVIESWQWEFGKEDGEGSTEKNPVVTYHEPGLYTVSLTVTGPGGSSRETKTAFIEVVAKEKGKSGILGCACTSETTTLRGTLIGLTGFMISWGMGYGLVRRKMRKAAK